MIPFFVELLVRFHEIHMDIEKALEQLPEEGMDWSPGPEMNSISVLITHLTGAERFWVGDVIKGDSSNRDRDAEFQVRGVDKNALRQRLRETEAYLTSTFETLQLSDLDATRTHPKRGYEVSVASSLLHALEHAAVHQGHIQMTAQLWQQKQI